MRFWRRDNSLASSFFFFSACFFFVGFMRRVQGLICLGLLVGPCCVLSFGFVGLGLGFMVWFVGMLV